MGLETHAEQVMHATRAQKPCERSRRDGESGQILVWTALLLPILVVATGLTLDVGNMINIRDELTNVVDAAALAATQAMHDPKASEAYVRAAAQEVAAQNAIPSLADHSTGSTSAVHLDVNATNAAGGDVVLGTYDFAAATFTRATPPVDISTVNAVQVNARLSHAARAMPLAFGRVVGVPAFDTTRTAMAVLASPVGGQPLAPMAIDQKVFTAKAKGFTPPNDIQLSTGTNMQWTGFFSGGGGTIRRYVTNNQTIPTLHIGDVIDLAGGTEPGAMRAMEAKWPAGSVIVVPVVSFGQPTPGEVTGFASMVISAYNGRTIDGEITVYKASLDPTTVAECFGTSCRSFLVN